MKVCRVLRKLYCLVRIALDCVLQKFWLRGDPPVTGNLAGTTALITGATGGVGRATAEILYLHGANLILPCRDVPKGEKFRDELRALSSMRGAERGSIVILKMDLASLDSVRDAAKELGNQTIDILILNAGIMGAPFKLSVDGSVESTFAVNQLSHFLLTRLLLPNLESAKAPRIIAVSSVAASLGFIDLDDLTYRKRGYNGMRAYCDSKAANILFCEEFVRRYRSSRIKINAVHPGEVVTDISRELPWVLRRGHRLLSPILLSPTQGAWTTVAVATSKNLQHATGKFFCWIDRPCSWALPMQTRAGDPTARDLWDLSTKLTQPYVNFTQMREDSACHEKTPPPKLET